MVGRGLDERMRPQEEGGSGGSWNRARGSRASLLYPREATNLYLAEKPDSSLSKGLLYIISWDAQLSPVSRL